MSTPAITDADRECLRAVLRPPETCTDLTAHALRAIATHRETFAVVSRIGTDQAIADCEALRAENDHLQSKLNELLLRHYSDQPIL